MSSTDQLHALTPPASPPASLTAADRKLVLVTVFLGWLSAGVLMQITSLAMRSAAIDLLSRVGRIDRSQFDALNETMRDAPRGAKPEDVLPGTDAKQLNLWRAAAQKWFAYYQCAFLFGAASGGFVFGRIGDRFGRAKAVAASILCMSLFASAAHFAREPIQLAVLWYLACLGIGGMWPNGVALVAETWSSMSRPMAAGIIGTAANVGIFGFASLATVVQITPDHWRWVMLVAAASFVLGLFVWAFVPESPRWQAARIEATTTDRAGGASSEIFRPPLLAITAMGILLATIPLFGGWGSANWMVPWAEQAGETADPPRPELKAYVGQCRSLTGAVGSLIGGWIASVVGRRRTYFLASVAALLCAQYAFWFSVPTDRSFLFWVAALGFFSGIYFGWLPLCLPELFPTRVRSTGAGVSFNFGRIATAVTVFVTASLTAYFAGSYARMGRVTSLIFAVGMIAIWFAPDSSTRRAED
jgi:MFS family permease